MRVKKVGGVYASIEVINLGTSGDFFRWTTKQHCLLYRSQCESLSARSSVSSLLRLLNISQDGSTPAVSVANLRKILITVDTDHPLLHPSVVSPMPPCLDPRLTLRHKGSLQQANTARARAGFREGENIRSRSRWAETAWESPLWL